MTKEKEIGRWCIGGKLTGITLVGSASGIEGFNERMPLLANDSGSWHGTAF